MSTDNDVTDVEPVETDTVDESSFLEDSKCVTEHQDKGLEVRPLSDAERDKLSKQDAQLVSEFKQRKLEVDAKKNWDLFYRRNKSNFFKDRYWTLREFDDLNEDAEASPPRTLLEIGCGVGNFLFPLLKQTKRLFVYACDFSNDAVALLTANDEYDTRRCLGFVCDATKPNSLRDALPTHELVDFVTLIFVLSAIHPDKMQQVVDNIATVVKPGGVVLIRDYAINDHTMIKFAPGHKLDDKFYARQDGTRTFFFTLAEMETLFTRGNMFTPSLNEYVFRETVNVKLELRAPRVYIQSKFVRTQTPSLESMSQISPTVSN